MSLGLSLLGVPLIDVPFPLTDLQLWLEGNSGIITNNTAPLTVASWESRNQKNTATQSTKANQFLFVPNAINGMPVVRGDGTQRQMAVSNFSLNKGLTLVALLRLSSSADFNTFFSKTTGNQPSPIDFYTIGGKFSIAFGSNKQNTPLTVGFWHIFSITHDKQNFTYYLDGVPDGSGTGGWQNNDTGNVILGSRDDGFTKLSGDIAGLVCYNGANNKTRQQVEEYFKKKRGF